MTKYVIRGGKEGKARLRIISDALWPASRSLLEGAGIQSGVACLGVGSVVAAASHWRWHVWWDLREWSLGSIWTASSWDCHNRTPNGKILLM